MIRRWRKRSRIKAMQTCSHLQSHASAKISQEVIRLGNNTFKPTARSRTGVISLLYRVWMRLNLFLSLRYMYSKTVELRIFTRVIPWCNSKIQHYFMLVTNHSILTIAGYTIWVAGRVLEKKTRPQVCWRLRPDPTPPASSNGRFSYCQGQSQWKWMHRS